MHWYQSAVTSTASILFNHNPFSYNGIFIVFSHSSTSFFVCLSVSVVFVDRCIHFPEWTALKIIVNLHLLTGETIVWDNVRRRTSTVHYYGFFHSGTLKLFVFLVLSLFYIRQCLKLKPIIERYSILSVDFPFLSSFIILKANCI